VQIPPLAPVPVVVLEDVEVEVLSLSPQYPSEDDEATEADEDEDVGEGLKTSTQLSSNTNLEVGSIRTRGEESVPAPASRPWLLVSSGIDNLGGLGARVGVWRG
jgi:hypothetical protein